MRLRKLNLKELLRNKLNKPEVQLRFYPWLIHKLRAWRTVCKSVFFSKIYTVDEQIEAYSGLKSRGLGDSAPCRSGRNY